MPAVLRDGALRRRQQPFGLARIAGEAWSTFGQILSLLSLLRGKLPSKTIDGPGHGSDGIWLADLYVDPRLDIATSWGQSGVVRGHVNPGTVTSDCVEGRDLDEGSDVDILACAEMNALSVFRQWDRACDQATLPR